MNIRYREVEHFRSVTGSAEPDCIIRNRKLQRYTLTNEINLGMTYDLHLRYEIFLYL